MRSHIICLVLVVVFFIKHSVGQAVEATAMQQELPTKFLGKFKHDHSENFDEYLTSKGVPWLIRKMIGFSSLTKSIEKAKSGEPGYYTMRNLSSRDNAIYENWTFGKSFEAKGFDTKLHRITFNMPDGDTLTEEHIRLDDPKDKGETYHYTIDGDFLVLKLESNSLVCRRFFKRLVE